MHSSLFHTLCLSILFPVIACRAELLFYEGFDYTVGEDQLVISGPWTGTGNSADIVDGNLIWQDALGNVLRCSGNSCLADAHQGTATLSNTSPVNLFAAGTGGGGDRWLSFVGRQTAGTSARFFNVTLRGPDNTLEPPDSGAAVDEIIAAGMPSAQPEGQFWRIWDRSTGGSGWKFALTPQPSTRTAWVVVRMELDAVGVSERFTVWIDPRLDVEPAAESGFQFVTSDSNVAGWDQIQDVRIGAGAVSGGQPGTGFLVDELRLGTTFADVSPHIPVPDIGLVPAGGPGPRMLRWTVRPGFSDVVEFSPDLAVWTPAGAAFSAGAVPEVRDYPLDSLTDRVFYRIRRLPD